MELNIAADGARVLLENQVGIDRLDSTLPGELYAGSGTRGWKPNASHTAWTYLDRTRSPVGGIVAMTITDRSALAPRRVKVTIKGKASTYPIVSGDEPVKAIVALGAPVTSQQERCGESDFAPGECAFNQRRNQLMCRK